MRSLTNRLALLFAAITAAVLLLIYLYVVSPLQSSLRDQQLSNLAAAAVRYSAPIEQAVEKNASDDAIDARVQAVAQVANARVTLLKVSRGTNGLRLIPRSDSSGQASTGDLQFLVALEAARERHLSQGTEAGTEGPVGEATKPVFTRDPRSGERIVASVLVFSAPQRDLQSNVALVRNRLVVAGLIALLIAIVAGYALARTLIGRVQRMESAARRVAAGDFTARFPTQDEDELGDLARALDDMQTQLAELETARKQFIATASHELRSRGAGAALVMAFMLAAPQVGLDVQVDLEGDVLANHTRQERGRLGDRGIEVQGARLEQLTPAERQAVVRYFDATGQSLAQP